MTTILDDLLKGLTQQAAPPTAAPKQAPDPVPNQNLGDASALRTAIRTGVYDNVLREIEEAVAARRKLVAARNAYALVPGDKVRITSTKISPQYLRGATATVLSVNQTRLAIKFDVSPKLRRFSGAQTSVPFTSVDKVQP